MDALMAAIVAAALAQIGDRTAWLVAILADRYAPGRIVAMAALALFGAAAIAATGGMLLAPMLTPNAKQLFFALALLLQGGGALVPAKPPERLDRWRIGAFATALLGLFILAFGDGIQFIVLAIAARSTLPWLAVVGATIGSLAVVVPAAVLGEAQWVKLPLKPVRFAIGILFLIVGAMLALDALTLI